MGKEDYLRVPITMPEDMFTFLENVSLTSKVTGGRKLANTTIVRACVMAMMELDVDINGVRDEEELRDRILQAQCRQAKTKKK